MIDRVTGEITLEKLSSQIRVKKTRQEKPDRHQQQFTQVPPDLNHWGDGEHNLLLNSGIFRRKLLRNEVTKLKYTQPGLQGSRLKWVGSLVKDLGQNWASKSDLKVN